MRRFIALGFLVLLASCTQYSLVESNKRQTIDGFYAVDPQIAWSKNKSNAVTTWTVNGAALDSVNLFDGLRDGESLFKPPNGKIFPKFRADMKAGEVMEFVVDSLAAYGAGSIETKNLRPTNFGSLPGFRFEMSFLKKDGLAVDAIVVGTIQKKKLYLIYLDGTRTHYFPKYKDTFEKIIASIQVL